MDSFELNKIAGAVLATLLVTLGLGIVADILFTTEVPAKPGYIIEVAEEVSGGGGAGSTPEAVPIGVLMASADAEKGANVAKKCAACHTFDDGGPNRLGPNLHGIVGRDIGTVAGFSYSDAMGGADGSWGYDELNQFLLKPKGYMSGTAMNFAGVKKDNQRANLIAYLASISPNAPPPPEVESEPAAEEGDGSEGAPAPEDGAQLQDDTDPVGSTAAVETASDAAAEAAGDAAEAAGDAVEAASDTAAEAASDAAQAAGDAVEAATDAAAEAAGDAIAESKEPSLPVPNEQDGAAQ